jgi:hypothetical protein
MICPIMSFVPHDNIFKNRVAHCVENDCAWWDNGNKCCVFMSILIELMNKGV